MAKGRDFGKEFVNNLKTDLCMSHFAPAEFEGDFHLHVLGEKIDRVLDFYAEIVRIDLGAELDLFDLIGVLMFFGFFVTLGLLIAVFAVVDEPAHWRGRICCNLDQVHAPSAGPGESIPRSEKTALFSIGP